MPTGTLRPKQGESLLNGGESYLLGMPTRDASPTELMNSLPTDLKNSLLLHTFVERARDHLELMLT